MEHDSNYLLRCPGRLHALVAKHGLRSESCPWGVQGPCILLQMVEGAAQLPGTLRSGWADLLPLSEDFIYLFFWGQGQCCGGGGHWELSRYVREAEAGLRDG